MNQDRLEGILKQIGGRAKELRGAFIGDPLAVAEGTRERLAGRVQEQLGISRQQSEQQLDEFMRRNRKWMDLSGR